MINWLICLLLQAATPVNNVQSPQLSVNLAMDSAQPSYIHYKIELKLCHPKIRTQRGDWFGHDTSAINFEILPVNDIDCGEYMENGAGIEVLSGENEYKKYNSYHYTPQLLAWEEIIVFRITNQSSRAWHQPMYLVLPLKYKSFVTYVSISGLRFHAGNIIVLKGEDAVIINDRLRYNYSLEQAVGIPVKDYLQNSMLE